MSKVAIAERVQAHADALFDDPDVPIRDVEDAMRVAADAWLEAGVPEQAAIDLIRAADYLRDVGGMPVLSLSEASAIAHMAGWLESMPTRFDANTLAPLKQTDAGSNVIRDYLLMLFDATEIPNASGIGRMRHGGDLPRVLEMFRSILDRTKRRRRE